MSSEPGIAIEPLVATRPRPDSVRSGEVMLLGIWIGLIAGYGDLGLMILMKRWVDRDFFRVGENFPWLIPASVAVLVLVPAFAIALLARIRGSVRLSVPLGLLAFLGFLDLCSRIRLEMWATLIVSAGLAVQSVRFVRPRRAGFSRFVRRTVWLLIAILVATALATNGRSAWSEYRQRSALPPAAQGARNVLLIVWDTVRASSTSLHGYNRTTTPNLEKLAGQGVRFDLAFSASSWTLPAHASLFTGRWPHEVGVDWKSPMRDGLPTLAEYLTSRGYDTAGFAANVDYCSRETGVARGFVHYEDYPLSIFDAFTRYVAIGRRLEASGWTYTLDSLVEKYTGRWCDLIPHSREHVKSADDINGSFLKWLGGRSEGGRPFFAFLNYNDAHTPYEVPDPSVPGFGLRPTTSYQRQVLQGFTGQDKTKLTDDDVRMANDVYDDCIAHLDRRLGSLLDELGRRGILDNTLVIFTSDHGEHLGDHGLFFHGGSLYRQVVQVPLVIVDKEKVPAGRRVAEAVSLSDIPATVIDLLGLDSGHEFVGQSVAHYWLPRGPEAARIVPRPLLMETTKPELLTNDGREPAARGPMKSVVAAGLHYIRRADGMEELYDLNADIQERMNLAGDPDKLPVVLQFRNLLGLLMKKR